MASVHRHGIRSQTRHPFTDMTRYASTDTASVHRHCIHSQIRHPFTDTASIYKHGIRSQSRHPFTNTASVHRHGIHLQTRHPFTDTSRSYELNALNFQRELKYQILRFDEIPNRTEFFHYKISSRSTL